MSTPTDPRAAVASIRAAMNATFQERRAPIDALLLAAVAGEHLVMLGPPGTAKSALLDAWSTCIIGANKFDLLMTRFTGPDEVFGPLMLGELRQDRYKRAIADFLPGAHLTFLDEVFKANSSILNALLKILNERTYAGAKVPLRMMVAASNELPEDETLAALYDRILLRVQVDYIGDDEKWKEMLRGSTFVPPVQLTIDDWDAIRVQVRAVPIPDTVLDALVVLKGKLVDQGVIVSDRRWKAMLGLLRAQAWIDNCAIVETSHLFGLADALWSKPEQRPTIRAALQGSDSGSLGGFLKKIDEAIAAAESITRDPAERRNALLDAIGKLGKAAGEIKKDPERERLTAPARERLRLAGEEMKIVRDRLNRELTASYGLHSDNSAL